MPKITAKQIIWDSADWFAGLVPQYGENSGYLYNGIESSISFNPFIKLGYASPGEESVDVTNTAAVDGAMQRIVSQTANSSVSYGVGGSKVYQINSTTGEIQAETGYPHAVATSTMEDIVRYTVSGVQYLFYSYNTTSTADIGRLALSTDTFVDSFWVTTLGAAALDKDKKHPLIIGDDDNLYVGDGNILKATDGTTANESALILPTDFSIKSFSKLGNRTLVIFADSSTFNSPNGKVRAYFWDYVSKDPYAVHEITGSVCGGASEYKGSLAVFTRGLSNDPSGSDRIIHFNLFNGSRFVKQRTLTTSQGQPPVVGGIEVIGEYLKVNLGGVIYSWGSPYEGLTAGMIPIADLAGGTNGAVKTLSTNRMFASSGDGVSGGLQGVYSGIDGNDMDLANASPNFPFEYQGRIDSVRVEFKEQYTDGIDIFLEKDSAFSPQEVKIADALVLTGKTFFKTQYATDGSGLGNFNRLKIRLKWSGSTTQSASPFIKRIIVEYTPVKIDNI